MAKTKVNTKNKVNTMKNSPKVKTKTPVDRGSITLGFKRTTVAPNIEQIAPKVYRARITVNGTRQSFQTTAITKAKTWLKDMKTTGKSTLS